MPYRNIIPFMYVLAFAFGILSIFAKATHITTPFGWFIASLAAQIFFAVAAIYELRSSEQLSNSQKSTWSGLLLVAPLFFGIFYLRRIRRKAGLNN